MALGFNNSPVNWNIDYSGNQVGQHYGNAIGNIGQQTGNAIMQFARQDSENKKKKEKEQQSIAFLVQRGFPEKQAKSIIGGIGLDTFTNLQQIDAQNFATEQRAAAAEAKAQQAVAETNAIKQAVALARQQQMPTSGPMAVLPPGGASGKLQNANGGMDANVFINEASARGVPTNKIQAMVSSINATNKANKPEKEKEGIAFTKGPNGEDIMTGPGQILPTKKDAKEELIPVGTREIKMVDGKPTPARWLGQGYGWENIETGAPLHDKPGSNNKLEMAKQFIAEMFGPGAAPSTPEPATAADLVAAVKAKKITPEEAKKIATKNGWK